MYLNERVKEWRNIHSDTLLGKDNKMIKGLLANKPEYGSYNAEGHFKINSEESLDRMLFEMYNHTFSLNEKLLKMIYKYL